MPIGGLGAIIGAGANLLVQNRNIKNQKETTKKQRAHELYQYDIQRLDAIRDRDFNNQYNHPLQQMARLKEAGLNPNLVYGKGAANTASQIRPSSMNNTSAVAPRLDPNAFQGAIGSIAQLKVLGAQTDNLHASAQNQQARTLHERIKTLDSTFDYGIKKELKATIKNQIKADYHKTIVDTGLSASRSVLADTQSELNVAKIDTEIAKRLLTNSQVQLTKEQVAKLQDEDVIRELNKQFARLKIRPGDPGWTQAGLKILDKIPSTNLRINKGKQPMNRRVTNYNNYRR